MAYSIGSSKDPTNQELVNRLKQGAPGAYPSGTKVIKIFSEDGDFAHTGDTGIVEGSMLVTKQMGILYHDVAPKYLYLVSWDHDKKSASLITDSKIDKI